jgi:hypothetical protein
MMSRLGDVQTIKFGNNSCALYLTTQTIREQFSRAVCL